MSLPDRRDRQLVLFSVQRLYILTYLTFCIIKNLFPCNICHKYFVNHYTCEKKSVHKNRPGRRDKQLVDTNILYKLTIVFGVCV